jgi:hypothetical protein
VIDDRNFKLVLIIFFGVHWIFFGVRMLSSLFLLVSRIVFLHGLVLLR